MKQKKQMYKLISRVALVILVSLLVVACSNSFLGKLDHLDSNRNGTGSTGTLTIIISDTGDGSRTILPVAITATDISTYDVLLERAGFSPISFTGLANLPASLPNIVIGKWTLTVSGFDSDAKKITEETTVIEVTAGACTASIVLKPIRTETGTGILDVKFNYIGAVGDIGQSSVVLTTYPELTPINIPTNDLVIDPDFTNITIKTPLPSRNYWLTINLKRTMDTFTEDCPPIMSIVQIYDNRISSAVFTMSADDLTQAPKAPTNFKITGVIEDNMIFEWDDNLNIAESYKLYAGEEEIGTPFQQTREFSVPISESNQTYTLKAVNRYGESAPTSLSYVAATGITLDRSRLVLGVGQTAQLEATVAPSTASLAPFIIWTSSDAEQASVVSSGNLFVARVTGVAQSIPTFVTVTATISRLSASAEVTVVTSGFANGSGTEAEPYIITTATDLDLVRYAKTAYFSQTAPITLIDEWVPIGTTSSAFTGSYNGNGNTITGLNITTAVAEPVGLFGVTNGAKLDGIGLIEVSIGLEDPGATYSGSLVGYALDTTIERCYSTGFISNSSSIGNVGGLVGALSTDSTLSQSWSSATVFGASSLGGLVGTSLSAEISNCYASGFMNGGGNNSATTSGLVGSATDGSISNCFAANSFGQISPTYGLVGSPGSAKFTNSYWDSDLASGLTTPGVGATGKITTEMMTRATFIDWDLDTIWFIADDQANFYPSLSPIAVEVDFGVAKEHYISGGTVSFGTSLETDASLTFSICNNGTKLFTPVVTLSNYLGNSYSISPPFSPVSIPAGSTSDPFTITLTGAKGDDPKEATLTISYDDPATPDFILLLTGFFSA